MLPLGLAHGIAVTRPVKKDQPLTRADVKVDQTVKAVALRRAMEADYRSRTQAAE